MKQPHTKHTYTSTPEHEHIDRKSTKQQSPIS